MKNPNILVIGSGVAGMEASLLLAEAGREVHLIEKDSLIGGQTIKFEEVYPNMECATCMVSPRQQEILQKDSIHLHLLSEVKEVKGSAGDFTITVKKKARYVNLVNCIGCGACYEPCPVGIPNLFEESLGEIKAVGVPCPGALPNVPFIDPEHCLRFNGKKKDCQACQDACMFDAIDYSEQDETLELKVGAILVATGFDMYDLRQLPQYGYGKISNVLSAMEFERLFAANGPTEGEIRLKDGSAPKSIGIIHCAGRAELGYCSAVCCMYSTKFGYFLKHKFHDADVRSFHSDLCVPGKSHQKFIQGALDAGIRFIRFTDIAVEGKNGKPQIRCTRDDGEKETYEADMVIVSPAMIPRKDTESLAGILGIRRDKLGFLASRSENLSPVETDKEGIFVTGCAEGPKDIPESISQAQAAAGKILALLDQSKPASKHDQG